MAERYEIVRHLGEGGQGSVFLVRDLERGGRLLALKRVSSDEQSREDLALEFRRLARLRHPALARAYDFAIDEQGPYFTSEFVDGLDLTTWGATATREEMCLALGDLLGALILLHERQIVHSDITPANILVSAIDGEESGSLGRSFQPKLIDLGGACRPGDLSGAITAGYAAPEILTGRGALPSSDLYSFGVILSCALLGCDPFGEGDAAQVVRRQIDGDLSLPEVKNNKLAQLCMELLSPDPASRPQTAEETLGRLAEATGLSLTRDMSSLRGADLPSPRMEGRALELAELMELVDRLDDSKGERVALVVGPEGAGKSTLLSEVAIRAQTAGFALVGRTGGSLSAEELIGQFVRASDGAKLSDVSAGILAPWMLGGGAASEGTGDHWSDAVGFAVVELLSLASSARPLLLLFDDLCKCNGLVRHLAEVIARAVAADRPSRPRVVLMGAVSSLGETELLRTKSLVELGSLDGRGVEALVQSMLPGMEVSEELPRAIYAASGGWPGSCEILVRRSVGSAGGGDLDRALSKAIDDFSEEALAGLVAVSLANGPIPDSVGRRLFKKDDLDRLMSDGIVSETHGSYGPELQVSLNVAQRAREKLNSSAIKTCGAALADLLEQEGREDLSHGILVGLGDTERACILCGRLAERFASRGDLATAAEWYERGFSSSCEDTVLSTQAGAAIGIWRRLGQYERALEVLPKAKMGELDRARLAAELTLESGRHEDALDRARQASENTDQVDLALTAIIAAAELQLGRHESCFATVERGLAVAASESFESEDEQVPRLAQIGGLACVYLGRLDRASSLFTRSARGFERSGDLLGQLKVSANLGVLYWRRGEIIQARNSYDRAIELARRIGDRAREGLHLKNRAAMCQASDDYASAYADYAASADIGAVLGNDSFRTQVEVNLADLLAHLGDYEGASSLAARALQRSRVLGQGRLEMHALFVAGKALLGMGDHVRAERRLEDARRRFAAGGDDTFILAVDLSRAELKLRFGDLEGAERLCDSAMGVAEKRGRAQDLARAQVSKARVLAESSDRDDATLSLLANAEEVFIDSEAKDDLWRIDVVRAGIHARAGRKKAASKSLQAARIVFFELLDGLPSRLRSAYENLSDARGLSDKVDGDTRTGDDRWTQDLEMLMEINRELTRELDPKRLLTLIMERAVELTGAERGMVILSRADGLEPVVFHQISDDAEVSFSRSVAEKVIREGRSALAVDALDDERFSKFVSVNAMKLRSILAVPLSIRRRAVGVIYLDSRLKTGVFSDSDHRLLEAFGAQAAIALETARLVSENSRRCSDLEKANEEIRALSKQLEHRLERKEATLKRVGALLHKAQSDESTRLQSTGLIGRSAPMQKVKKLIDRISMADVPVYIYGPSGTGKELVARAIHSMSERKDKPFVPVNCGALPSKLLASELFGHVKGSFTGAVSDRPGLFNLSDHGVLFLDEVVDMDAEMQAHLLRVLQDGKFRPLGSNEEVETNVRIISASNRNIDDEVASGRFREDLLYRLNVVRIDVPSLAERREDIPLLVEFFAARQKKDTPVAFSREALDLLIAAEWQGNVRELENEVLRAVAMSSEGELIVPSDLSPRIRGRQAGGDWSASGSLKERVDSFEKVAIERVLTECHGNATKAAKTLGISRAGFYKKIDKHNISHR